MFKERVFREVIRPIFSSGDLQFCPDFRYSQFNSNRGDAVVMLIFAVVLVLLLSTFLLVLAGVQRRMNRASLLSAKPAIDAARYRPMLRLLTEDGVLSTGNRQFRSRRRAIFRQYLRSLTRDYSQLLNGLRTVMAASRVDRPDLAKALARNRVLFTLAICRIEIGLLGHAAGFDTFAAPDLSGIIAGLDVLRAQIDAFQPSLSSAA